MLSTLFSVLLRPGKSVEPKQLQASDLTRLELNCDGVVIGMGKSFWVSDSLACLACGCRSLPTHCRGRSFVINRV